MSHRFHRGGLCLTASTAEGWGVWVSHRFHRVGLSHRFHRVGLGVASLILGLLLVPGLAGAAEIELGFLNRTWADLDSGLEPIREGPFTIRLSSPEHRLIVHANRLRLQPNRRGLFDVSIEIELEGTGQLIADVEGAGLDQRFTDEVTAPLQTVRATGEIRLERTPEGDLRFTVEDRGPAAAVEIRSAIVGQIVGICRALAFLPIIPVGCDRLERALSVVRIPLPKPGTSFLLPAPQLTAEELAFFDQLLGDDDPSAETR